MTKPERDGEDDCDVCIEAKDDCRQPPDYVLRVLAKVMDERKKKALDPDPDGS